MELDYDRLVALRRQSAAWRLLTAGNAALTLSLFNKIFVEQGTRSASGPELTERLDDELFALNDRGVETKAHYTYTDPLSAGSYGRQCSECGEDRQTIVTFEPIGLRGKPPEATEPLPPPKKKLTRAELERRVKTPEKENERLRAKFSG
ncbi:hypothetical protein CTZ27_00690 [Streptomyces griseocarneus]|nr:hypothetical protein CTZ27_00690 [Streptomyces griseocarneus]